MAKSFQSNSNLSNNPKSNHLTKKYTCGCGKKYTSYPAFSTHRKTKHNNLDVQGTYIPKFQNPKRGRPSYEFVKKSQGKMRKINSYYQGLTVIQLGLLKLNQLFQGKILSLSHQSNRFTLPDELITIASHDGEKTKGENLVFDITEFETKINKSIQNGKILFLAKLLILFVQLMTTHMNQEPGKALIDFITELIVYVASIKKDSMQNDDHNDQDNDEKEMIDVSIFNQYFSRQENKEQINKLGTVYGLRQEFFVRVCVILSHWMYKLGYSDKVIKIRIPATSNKMQNF